MAANLLNKLQEAKQRIEEAKNNLNHLTVSVESENGEISVEANANKTITGITISESFYTEATVADFESVLLSVINKALDEAARTGEIEMKKITNDMLPNFPGLI